MERTSRLHSHMCRFLEQGSLAIQDVKGQRRVISHRSAAPSSQRGPPSNFQQHQLPPQKSAAGMRTVSSRSGTAIIEFSSRASAESAGMSVRTLTAVAKTWSRSAILKGMALSELSSMKRTT